jgi:3-phenylpropionate/trans-cinnamate dioxygenase ferredoxin reductase component
VGVEDPTAVRAARRMIDRGIAVDSVRLADPAVDCRTLLRG